MKNELWPRALTLVIALSLVGCGVKNDATPASLDVAENAQTEILDAEGEVTSETTVFTETTEIFDQNNTDSSAEDEAEALAQAEEERKRAEEEARIKAEEERKRAEEEARIKAEEEKKLAEQRNSFSMMYHLAITAEEIRTSKDNRVALEDIYTSLLNDINPDAVDEITQEHLKNLRDIIKSYLNISAKKERLNFIYNQEKASVIRNSVPNPLAVLSVSNALDWKKLALAVTYTAVDSYNNYKKSDESADIAFIMSGWELEDEEKETVMKNRDRAFDYMIDMVQKYDLDGMKTLNEKAIEKFAEICAIENASERIKLLRTEESTYSLLGNYWLELADCYFETSQYSKCLDCVDKYNELATGIYRKDSYYLQILPKAIVAAQETYAGDKYIDEVSQYADEIIYNTSIDDWANRYFAAQVYLDLYSRTNDKSYLESAYKITSENVADLLKYQRSINTTYLCKIEEQKVEEPDYRYMTEDEQKKKKQEYKEEQKRVKEYNKALKDNRKTELLSLYDPLVVNCEFLFALVDKMNIDDSEKAEIESYLQTEINGIFMVKPINDAFSFTSKNTDYSVEINKDEIIIPAYLLTASSKITVTVKEGSGTQVFDDCVVSKVERKGETIDTFYAHVSSKMLKKYEWTADSKISIEIRYDDVYGKKINLDYYVSEFENHWYGDKVVFAAL